MKIIFLSVLVGLAACSSGGAIENTSPISGTTDSHVLKLKVGMSTDQVDIIIGPSVNESEDSSSSEWTCRSYIYDETIDLKYVHAFFMDGLLQTASDGHQKLCAF